MPEEKKCVDFHAHPVTDAFRAAMTDLGIDPLEEDGFPLPKWSAEEHLVFMEEAGIDYAVLSAPVPHIYSGDAEKARRAARRINEETAEIVRRYPERFGFAGLIPLPDVEGALEETAYVLDELGAAGVKAATNMGSIYLGDPLFDPVVEEYDFSRKRTIPFCSHGGGRFGQSLTAIAKLAPDAVIGEGLSVHYSGGSSLSGDVSAWLSLNGIGGSQGD